MILSLDQASLGHYLTTQLDTFYPDTLCVKAAVQQVLPAVIERLDYCFSRIHKKYYYDEGQAIFNHRNSDHYAMFLYLVANEAYRQQAIVLAEKAFLLNKALHGLDAFYAITLPDIFLFVHPLGTILGNAHYANYFVVYQNVTVGTDVDGVYPVFGESNVLYAKSTVIGHCTLGNNVSLAAHALLRNKDIPADTIVLGQPPQLVLKENKHVNQQDFFHC